jgi:hypothetical protein
MQQVLMRSAVVGTLLVAFGLWGCGKSGSNPIQYPEVRFDVRPAGQANFRVDSLIGNGTTHTSIIGQQFTATSDFSFLLENAAPPYQGSFTLVGVCTTDQVSTCSTNSDCVAPQICDQQYGCTGTCTADSDCPSMESCDFGSQQITVTLTVIMATGQTQVSDATLLPEKRTATVLTGGTLPPGTPAPSIPEVRFDVCAPLSGQGTCTTDAAPGAFGVIFNGTMGDQFTSHLLNSVTPSIYFLEGARENVNGVFMRNPLTADLLIVQLFLNGALNQTVAGSGSVILKQDL